MDILNQIQKAITESGYEKKIRTGVVLTGGGSSLRHLKELCQYTLQRNTRIGIPDIGFVNSIPAELRHPMFATSLGLLKHGVQVRESERLDVGALREMPNSPNSPPTLKSKKPPKSPKPTPKPKTPKPTIWDNIKGFLDDVPEKTS
jgi:cell division protein FtsA